MRLAAARRLVFSSGEAWSPEGTAKLAHAHVQAALPRLSIRRGSTCVPERVAPAPGRRLILYRHCPVGSDDGSMSRYIRLQWPEVGPKSAQTRFNTARVGQQNTVLEKLRAFDGLIHVAWMSPPTVGESKASGHKKRPRAMSQASSSRHSSEAPTIPLPCTRPKRLEPRAHAIIYTSMWYTPKAT